jgi:hypothetical protein
MARRGCRGCRQIASLASESSDLVPGANSDLPAIFHHYASAIGEGLQAMRDRGDRR